MRKGINNMDATAALSEKKIEARPYQQRIITKAVDLFAARACVRS